MAAETIVELAAKDRITRLFVSQAHKIIDLYFEGPLVILTLVTGVMLLAGIWPNVTALLIVKIAIALVAIVGNLFCIHWVVRRARATTDDEFLKWARKITFSGYAVPFGVIALLIGLFGL